MTARRAALLSAALAGIVSLPALSNGFAIDDSYLIVDNPPIHRLANVPRFFLEPWGEGSGGAANTRVNAAYYRPLTSSLFAVEHALFGLRPFGWHLASALLHALAAALATLLAQRVADDPRAALTAGALFAVMPVHSEAIAAASYQTTLLAAVLSGAALLAFGRVLDGNGRARRSDLALLAITPAAAFLAKEEAVAVPALVAAWALLLRPAGWRRAIAVGVGVTGVSTAAALMARAAVAASSGVKYFAGLPAATVARTMLTTLPLYARLLVFPVRLCPFYDWFIVPPQEALSAEAVLGAAIVVVGAAGTALAIRRARDVAVGIAWLAVPLLPVMQVIPILNVAAERFLYLPSLGFCLTAGSLSSRAMRSVQGGPRRALSLAVALAIAGYGLRTMVRLPAWRDDRTLNRTTARDFPETPTPLLNLAEIDERDGRIEQAAADLEEAARRAPGWEVPLRRLAALRSRQRGR